MSRPLAPPAAVEAAPTGSGAPVVPTGVDAPDVSPPVSADAAVSREAVHDDDVYFDFEALHRGTEQEIARRQAGYVELFAGRQRVIDLGCGRGEMLTLLGEHGIGAYGVDINTAMVDACRQRGLEVVLGDAEAHLASLADDSLDGAFSAQTFEHWEHDRIVTVVRLLYRKLADGAAFVMETQNPLSLVVGASSFWRDITHRRPIHPDAFRFLVRAVGFRSVELRQLSPFPDAVHLPRVNVLAGLPESTRRVVDDVNRTIDTLDDLLYGHGDYAVIARK